MSFGRRGRALIRRVALAVSIALLAVSLPAFGQQGGDQADALYQQGKALYAEGKLEAAEAVLARAWELRQSYDIAAQLGGVKRELKKNREAAALLSFAFEHWAPSGNPDGKASVKTRLDEVLKSVATVRIDVNAHDAKVEVDGAVVQDHEAPVFVDPGKHDFVASKEGFVTARVSVDAAAGSEQAVTLRLEPVGGDMASENDHPMIALLGVGYGVGGAAVVVSVVLGGVAASKASRASDLESELEAALGERPCAASSDPRCADVKAAREAHRDMANPALWLGVGGGAVLIATAIYHLATASGASVSESAWRIEPLVAPSGVGAWVGARW